MSSTVDPDRSGLFQRLALARGPDYCLRAPPARLKAVIALRALVARDRPIEIDLRLEPTAS